MRLQELEKTISHKQIGAGQSERRLSTSGRRNSTKNLNASARNLDTANGDGLSPKTVNVTPADGELASQLAAQQRGQSHAITEILLLCIHPLPALQWPETRQRVCAMGMTLSL